MHASGMLNDRKVFPKIKDLNIVVVAKAVG